MTGKSAIKKQLYVKQEDNEFVAIAPGSLAVAANAAFLPFNASIEFDPDFQDRPIQRNNFGKAPGVAGKRTGRLKVSVELVSNGVPVTNNPQFHDMLRGSGVRYSTLSKITWSGTLSGTGATNKVIRHGTLLTQGANVYQVVGDYPIPATPAADSQSLFIGRLEGIGVGTIATGTDVVLTYLGVAAGTIATAEFTAVASNQAVGYWPFSFATSRLNFDATGMTSNATKGDILKGVNSKAIARVFKTQALGINTVLYVELITGHFSAGEVINNETLADADVGMLTTGTWEQQVSVPSLSAGLNEDGRYGSIAGARGNATFKFQGSKLVTIDFDFQGVFRSQQDAPIIESGIAALQRTPPAFRNASMVLGPYNSDLTSTDQQASADFTTVCVSSMELATGNELTLRECANASEGALGYSITDRKPTLKMDPDVVTEQDFGWVTKMLTNALVRGSWLIGQTPPDKFIFGFQAGQTIADPTGDRAKVLIDQVSMNLTVGAQDTASGDNEWWLICQGV